MAQTEGAEIDQYAAGPSHSRIFFFFIIYTKMTLLFQKRCSFLPNLQLRLPPLVKKQ